QLKRLHLKMAGADVEGSSSGEMNPYPVELDAELCRKSLAEFVSQSWSGVEPSTELVWNWDIEVIGEHVQAWMQGRTPRNNLVINVPPGSMKSRIVSVCAPAWMWTHKPTWRAIFASASGTVAMRDAMYCRTLLDSK